MMYTSTAMSTHSPLLTGRLCPCCNNALKYIRRDLVEISELMRTQLPDILQQSLAPNLAELRTNGRKMLDGLRRYFDERVIPDPPTDFEESLLRLNTEVDRCTRSLGADDLTEVEASHLQALRLSFTKLASDVRQLSDELNMSVRTCQ